MNRIRTLLLLAVAGVAALAATGCGGASDTSDAAAAGAPAGPTRAKLSLVAYSTPQVVYDEAIPAFQRTPAGRGVAFTQSFGASGEQSRAVASGLPADVVEFSLAPDLDRLVKAGLVGADWTAQPYDGFVSRSVVALIVRKGNPKHIRTWADLLRPGVKVLTPNPFTSGAAKWNLLAAYGAASDAGRDPQAGLAYVSSLIHDHVTVQDKSGREALQNFLSGTGDVLLSYENEAITAKQKGKDVDDVVPDRTILIENPIGILKNTKHPVQARAFVSYLFSGAGQEDFARHGYRPVDPAVFRAHAKEFPTPKGLFTIRDLGGWSQVNDTFFDPDHGSFAAIERDAGVSTDK